MKIRKFIAIMIALVMVFAMAAPAFAGSVPSANDRATVTIKNVEEGAEVILYKIVDAEYNSGGLLGYKAVKSGSISDITKPTADEVSALATNTSGLASTNAARDAASGDYTASVGAGTYMVLVKGTGATVYNPMIVSVNYDENSAASGGTVDAQTNWSLEGVTAYAKSTTPSVDKEIVNSDGNSNGNDVAIGDTVSFKITTAIPSYSKQYTDLRFDVRDVLSAGFDPAENIAVTVGGTAVQESQTTYTITKSGNSFEVSFASDYIAAHGGDAVVVTYEAEVNDSAALNYNANTNKATILYSNDPTDSTSYGTKEDKTYTYTFAIDGMLGGAETTQDYRTHELIKINEDGSVSVVDSQIENLDAVTVTNPLAGAVFTLTSSTGKEYTAVSDENGYLAGFTGLDAGSYTLVEKTAPQGYVADTTEHEVVISTVYNDDGTLSSYSITIDGKNTSTYTAVYSNGEITGFNNETTQTTLEIKNSKIPGLPSTGGIGSTVFYILGAVLIVCAGILLITKRRVEKKA